MQVSENSLLIEQNRRIIALLEDIKKQGSMLQLSELSQEDQRQALSVRLQTATLQDAFEAEAARRNMSLEDFTYSYLHRKGDTWRTFGEVSKSAESRRDY